MDEDGLADDTQVRPPSGGELRCYRRKIVPTVNME
jgi:hypothetical protein